MPSQSWAASSRSRNSALIGSDTPCVANSDFSRLDQPRVILRQRFQGPREVARVFFRHGGHAHDAPRASVTQDIPRQQTQEAREIETVGLRPSGSPIHFDARGIDHVVRDPPRPPVAMQPEAVAARLVTTDHRRVRRQAQPLLGSLNLRSPMTPTAPAGICRMRGRCPIPTVNPSFHDRWPNSNANNKQPVGAVDSSDGSW